MVGYQKTRAICALPPAKRVQMISRLRAAALKAYAEAVAISSAQTADTMAHVHAAAESPVSGYGYSGATGAHGPGELGSPNLFMGA